MFTIKLGVLIAERGFSSTLCTCTGNAVVGIIQRLFGL